MKYIKNKKHTVVCSIPPIYIDTFPWWCFSVFFVCVCVRLDKHTGKVNPHLDLCNC